jgi:dTDP-glucose pyrophosphorylase
MKTLVLSGATGPRLRPLTHMMATPLIPTANRIVVLVQDHRSYSVKGLS